MQKTIIDNNLNLDILAPEEVAFYLRKSTSWVYKHWQDLGGGKLGGSLFFPRKEDLYELLFRQRKGVEVRLHPERDQAHGGMVQNQKRGPKGRSGQKGGNSKPDTGDAGGNGNNPNRHGLLGAGQ